MHRLLFPVVFEQEDCLRTFAVA